MKKKSLLRCSLFSFSLLVSLTESVYAGGFQVNLQSTRRVGMGNVGVGYAPGASSIFYNPGALGMIQKTEFTVGGSLIFNKTAYSPLNNPEQGDYNNQTEYTKSGTPGTPFFAYAAHRITSNQIPTKFVIGLAVLTPFGSTVNWGNNWSGKHVLQNISLEAFYVQPTIAYQLLDGLSIGVGLDIIWGGVTLQKDLSLPLSDASIKFEGNSDIALSYNAGLFWQVNNIVSLGLNYRHKVELKVEQGQISYSDIPAIFPANYFPSENRFNAALPMPSVLAYGMGLNFKKFALAFDVNYIFWSAYKNLILNYEKPIGGGNSTVSARNYRDSWIFNVGGEYFVLPQLTLRAGAYYDITPVQNGYMTPESPDSDAIGSTVGFSMNLWKGLSLDAAFLYIYKFERKNEPNPLANGLEGHYKTHGFIPSLSFSYKF